MYIKEVVSNRLNLVARNATNLVQIANQYKSSIWLECKERRVNGKSLLGIIALGISRGDVVKVVTSGSDEVAASNAVVGFIECKTED